MRKSAWTGLLAVATLIAAAFVGFLLPSSAMADTTYGGKCASIAVSATVVNPGESITVTGMDFDAGQVVHLKLYPKVSGPNGPSTSYGPVTADANGNFTLTIVMPDDAKGAQILVSDGVQADCPSDPIQIRVSATGGTSQPPAHTGVDIALLVGVAVVLLGAGVLFTRGGKRRRIAAQS